MELAAAVSQMPREELAGSIDTAAVTSRITVRGRLTERLASALGGLDLEPGIEQAALAGEIRDQSHLYGVLDLARGLGADLVSVETNSETSKPGVKESSG